MITAYVDVCKNDTTLVDSTNKYYEKNLTIDDVLNTVIQNVKAITNSELVYTFLSDKLAKAELKSDDLSIYISVC